MCGNFIFVGDAGASRGWFFVVATVAIIGSKGIPARYGGFETLAENLVKHLSSKHEFIVYCSAEAYPSRRSTYLGAKLVYLPLNANGVQSVPYDIWSMIDASRKADVLLVLGVSGCIFLPLLKLFSKKTVVVHLDGIDWQRPKWGWLARNFLRLSENIAVRFADKLIADNTAIQEYIHENYRRKSEFIAYGGDNAVSDLPVKGGNDLSVVSLHKTSADMDESLLTSGAAEYVVAVCRIEPENNVHVILDAFTKLDSLSLIFIGNWAANDYGKSLRKQYRDVANIQMIDPIYRPEKLFNIRSNALLYVHGHSAGGTNPSLVEAMCLGLPVMAYDVIFNRATTHNKAIYFSNTSELLSRLRNIDRNQLQQMSETMLDIGRDQYTWSIICSHYDNLFVAFAGAQKEGKNIRAEFLPKTRTEEEPVDQSPPEPRSDSLIDN